MNKELREAASIMGSARTERKAKTSRANGRKHKKRLELEPRSQDADAPERVAEGKATEGREAV